LVSEGKVNCNSNTRISGKYLTVFLKVLFNVPNIPSPVTKKAVVIIHPLLSVHYEKQIYEARFT
jgi:hypothetical protein